MLIKVDVSDASSTSSGNWNNITANGGSVSDCVDFDTGSATGISCAASGGWAGENGGGTTGWSDYPDSATADSLYISSTAQTCTFGSLNSAKTYRVRVIAARNTGATDRVGEYTVDSTLKEIDAAGAVDTWAEWTGVSPDGSDEIVIDVAIKSGSSFAYLNIVELEEESSGAYTLSADSGSFTLTGTNASLLADRKMSASSGSFTLNGTSAGLTVSRKLAAENGTFTLSGTAVSLIRDYYLAGDSGSYTLSGTDVTLTYTPAAGSYTLTADSGSYTLSGATASLTAQRVLAADSGTFTLNGTTVALNHGYSISADSGSYSLVGTAVSFVKDSVLSAESGAYTLSGTDVTLTYFDSSVPQIPGAPKTPSRQTNWRDLVVRADKNYLAADTSYQFSNGRKFH